METKLFHSDAVNLWERRLVFLFDSKEVKLSDIEAKKQVALEKEKTEQEKIKLQRDKTRLEFTKLGIPFEESQGNKGAETRTETETTIAEVEPIGGPTGNFDILKKISSSKLEKHRKIAKRINDLLAGKNVKNPKKRARLQATGEKILQKIDPTYQKPQSKNFSQETEKVVAKLIQHELPEETLKKIEKDDLVAEQSAAKKITEIYQLLELSRRLHHKEIRKNTRNALRLPFGSAAREHRHKLIWSRKVKLKKFEKAKYRVFPIAEQKKKKGFFRKERSAKFLTDNLIKKPYNFILDKTFRKGKAVGIARSALWIGGSAITGGIPIIPAAVEGAVWAGKQIKLGEKLKKQYKKIKGKPITDSEILNAVNIATLGIPLFVLKELKKLYESMKLNPIEKK